MSKARNGERILKKIGCLSSAARAKRKEIAKVVQELSATYPLKELLKLSGIPRSTYYYLCKGLCDKFQKEKEIILKIFEDNKARYGYRRIVMVLKSKYGIILNHKTVLKIMRNLGIRCKNKKNKYNSYKGTIGKIANNELLVKNVDQKNHTTYYDRDFTATAPNQKWATDITEFKVLDSKVYLSPIIDLYNSEIISYNISLSPNMTQIRDMMSKALKKLKPTDNLIFHSDQGWQYQQNIFQRILKENNIVQSMSRKGNCLDNSIMENFFGRLKTEMYYGVSFSSMDEFISELNTYIDYYNNYRIKAKLKGLSPVEYRLQSFS